MTEPRFTVTLKQIIDEFRLEVLYCPGDPAEILIAENDITRPGLQLMGFYEYFNPERIQIIGKMEFAQHIKCLCLSRGLPCFAEMLTLARQYSVPVLRTAESTSHFTTNVLSFLNLHLAPRVTRHGVLIEIYGEGIFITGESGVGKSECAIELVKRGHRLVADDAVELRKVSNTNLVGTSPENIRHFLELRGIGIINVRRLFGMGAVKLQQEIDMIIELEPWDSTKTYAWAWTNSTPISSASRYRP